MGNGGDRRPNVPLVNTNADALDQARGIVDRSLSPRYRRRQFGGMTGEQGARDYIQREYRGRIKREIPVPRRTWGDEPPILDSAFELDNGEFIVVEAKAGDLPMGKIRKDRYVSDAQRGVRIEKGAVEIAQFTPQWFEAKLTEIAEQDSAACLSNSASLGRRQAHAAAPPSAGALRRHRARRRIELRSQLEPVHRRSKPSDPAPPTSACRQPGHRGSAPNVGRRTRHRRATTDHGRHRVRRRPRPYEAGGAAIADGGLQGCWCDGGCRNRARRSTGNNDRI